MMKFESQMLSSQDVIFTFELRAEKENPCGWVVGNDPTFSASPPKVS
jgi:hypothetical protein